MPTFYYCSCGARAKERWLPPNMGRPRCEHCESVFMEGMKAAREEVTQVPRKWHVSPDGEECVEV